MLFDNKKSDRKLKKEKEILENKKASLELKNEIKRYFAWRRLPHLEKALIRQSWNVYYKKVKNTKTCEDYFELKKYWSSFKEQKFKKLVEKARQRLENQDWELSRPQGIDPWEFSHGIYYKYDNICNKIRQISKRLTGVEGPDEIF